MAAHGRASVRTPATRTAVARPSAMRRALPGRDRQREPLDTAALTGDRDLAGPPVDGV